MLRILSLLLCCVTLSASAKAASEVPPNIIVVVTDDQGFPNLGFNGHPVLQTPHIDSFASSATRLTNYHVDPTCAPTRSALLTGRYSDRVGVWHTVMGRSFLRKRETTMANLLGDAGYATGIFGKWHLGDVYPFRPEDRGFQEVLIHGGGGVGQAPDFWGNDYFDDVYQVNGVHTQFKGYCTDIYFSQAKKFIQASKESGQPFFAYIVPNAPHGPMYAPDKYSERVAERLKASEYAHLENKGLINYYGMIENIDDNFGGLRKFLKEQGLEENTLLVFSSDNGAVTGAGEKIFNAGLNGMKGSNFDGGHLVPWIMRWPKGGLDQGVDVAALTAHVDILPTFLELAGVEDRDIAFDGKSLVPLLKGKNNAWPERSLIVESQRVVDPIKYRQSAVMNSTYRLVGNQKEEFKLFNVLEEGGQTKDLAKELPEVVSSMRAAYEVFWDDVSKEHDLVSRMIVGSEYQNPTPLTSHDWLGNTLWSQKHILKPNTSSFDGSIGHWEVDIAHDGWHQISLRRWPAEADRAICDAYVGLGFSVTNATLIIQGQSVSLPIAAEDKEVTFRVKLEQGDAKIETLFSGAKHNISAFYAYILREEGPVDDGWQTREGLGLPIAVWPENHGADPSAVK